MFWLMMNNPMVGIPAFCMLILAISVHEMAHAWMAYRCGDDTAARMGRLTINPVVHFDAMGFMFIMFAFFGWGRPVPFNPLRLRNMHRDTMLIAAAGPASNVIQAVFLALLFRIITIPSVAESIQALPSGGNIFTACILVFSIGVSLNLVLAFFNLIPLFPLDGEKILIWFLPREQAIFMEDHRQHGTMILFMIIGISFFLDFPILHYYFNMTSGPISRILVGFSFF